jgi:hypothetical protein
LTSPVLAPAEATKDHLKNRGGFLVVNGESVVEQKAALENAAGEAGRAFENIFYFDYFC